MCSYILTYRVAKLLQIFSDEFSEMILSSKKIISAMQLRGYLTWEIKVLQQKNFIVQGNNEAFLKVILSLNIFETVINI